MGDPCGIGPELTLKLLAEKDIREMAQIVVIGDSEVYGLGEKSVSVQLALPTVQTITPDSFKDDLLLLDTPKFDMRGYVQGQVSKQAGEYQLSCLGAGLDYCRQGLIDAVCFAPLNKEAMHLAGLVHEDETGFFRDKLDFHGEFGILNTLGNLWTSRATSHIAHREVSEQITVASVYRAITLLDRTLKKSGNANPQIAVAGLNPHAGDGGMFGEEEKEKITPAVEAAKQEGVHVDGPFPPDTIFLMGRDGKYDAIVTMYHDQGQIAMKLMGFDHGVTVHAGLPYPVTTSAHGSAFDIAGQGVANVSALREAFILACKMTKQN